MATSKTITRIRSPQDLEQARAQALQHQPIRTGCVIYIGTATCCLAMGAADTLDALCQEVQQRQLVDLSIVEIGCMGLCALEPVVEVHLPGRPPVLYGQVTPQAMRRIVQEHVLQGDIIPELVISRQEVMPAFPTT